jgi:hypothetical protein
VTECSPNALQRLGWLGLKRTCVAKGTATLGLHAPDLDVHTLVQQACLRKKHM